MTLAGWEALEERRAAELRHQRFNAALIATAILNVNRAEGTPPLSPFAFIPGYGPDPEEQEREERRRTLKRSMQVVMARLPNGVTPEQVQEVKQKMLTRAKAAGHEDAEEIFNELFPGL